MKTWVLWTHYECEVGVSLWPSAEDAYLALKADWLGDCNDDECGHTNEDNSDIADALEYHFEELSYDMTLMEVPLSTTVSASPESTQPPVTILDEQAGDLMSRLESFSHE